MASLFRHPTIRKSLGFILALYIRLVFHTSRWRYVGFEDRRRLRAADTPFIILCWHNRLMMAPYLWNRRWRPMAVLASGHRDGRLVADVLAHFGYRAILHSRHGDSGVRPVIRALRDGLASAITPDGPRGPSRKMKPGAAAIAGKTGARLVLAGYSVRRRIVLGSWDRFWVPLPFNSGVFLWREMPPPPQKVDAATREHFMQQLEDALNALTDEGDRMMGHAPATEGDATLQPRKRVKS